MAVRLGTQNWINPGPFQAAAEMAVEAGRATGAGYAALGAGIGNGLQAYGAKQERKQHRQDILAQQGIENARSSRAEDRLIKDGKIALLEKSVLASKMELDVEMNNFNSFGTPEAQARVEAATKKHQQMIDLYKMSLVNNGSPNTPVTDYVGAGQPVGSGGWAAGQSPSEKAQRGEPTGDAEVYWNAKDYADSETAGGVGNIVPPQASAASVPSASPMAVRPPPDQGGDFMAELAAAAAAGDPRAKVAVARGEAERTKALAERFPKNIEYRNAAAKAQSALTFATLGYEKQVKVEDDIREKSGKRDIAAENAARVARINEGRKARGLPPISDIAEVGPQMTTERTSADLEKRQTFATQQDLVRNQAANARQANAIAFKERWNKRKEEIAVKYKDATLAAQATQQEIDNQKVRMQAAESNYVMLRKQYDDGKDVGEEFYGSATKPSAYAKYQDEMAKYMAMTDEDDPAPSAAPAVAPAPASAPAQAPSVDEFVQSSPELKAKWDAMSPDLRAQAVDALRKAGKVR